MLRTNPETAAERGRSPGYWLLLATVSLASVLAPLNSTMLAVALPQIRGDFDVGHAEIGWLVSAYLIAMAIAQPLGGRLGDQLGRARVFRVGLTGFLALSVAAALAPNYSTLLLLRTGQGLIGGSFIPNGMAMLRESMPVTRLGRSTGLTGGAISLSAASGPLLGAGLLALGSWRLLFVTNVPLVVLALTCGALLAYRDVAVRRSAVVDWMAAGAFGAMLVSLTFLLNSLRDIHGTYLLGAGVAALAGSSALFLRRQFRSDIPIAEWRLFRSRSFAAATAYILLSNLVMYTTLLAIPFFVEEVQGKDSTTTGTLLGAMSVLMVLTAPLAGRLSDFWGRRALVFMGSLALLAGTGLIMGGLSRDVSFAYVAVSLAVLGLGVGLSIGPASTAAIEAAPRHQAGAAAGTSSMMRYLGSIVGAGVLGAILNSEGALPDVDVFRFMFAILVAMAFLGTACTPFIHRLPHQLSPAGTPTADTSTAAVH